jgi:hypothetical protein
LIPEGGMAGARMLAYRLTTKRGPNALSSRVAGQELTRPTLQVASRGTKTSAVRHFSSIRAALPPLDFMMSSETPVSISDVRSSFMKYVMSFFLMNA